MDEHTATELAYKNGYEKGYADAKAELVRCKDCKHIMHSAIYKKLFCTNIYGLRDICISKDDFCSYGERREGE